MIKSHPVLHLFAILFLMPTAVSAEPQAHAHYLANASVMVARGETKVIFDPLFRNDFGAYDLVPEDMEAALFAGTPPWDGIDAVFISHSHEDHFDAKLMLEFLQAQRDIQLFAPAQAVADLRAAATETHTPLFARVQAVTPAYGALPTRIEFGDLQIEASRIPHSGWPDRRTDIENVAFRVTLDKATTVMHLGDADPRLQHFEHDESAHAEDHLHLALPPFWFYIEGEGRQVLDEHLKPQHTIGVHVPTRMPDDPDQRPAEFQGVDLFTEPGEIREIAQTSKD